MTLSSGSLAKLKQCDDGLLILFTDVAEVWPCEVVVGARLEEDEAAAIASGHSHLTNPRDSKHVIWEGRPKAAAVDVVPLPLDWKDADRFRVFAGYVLGRARAIGIPIRWGGMWNGIPKLNTPGMLQDLDHFERTT